MSAPTRTRRWLTICAAVTVSTLVGIPAGQASPGGAGKPFGARELADTARHRVQDARSTGAHPFAAAEDGDGGEAADEIAEGAAQYAEARTSPGTLRPGAYTAAWNAMQALPQAGGRWRHVTKLPYDSDDPRYRDIDSNSSGGAGRVTGRTTALAADGDGYVYAGSAGGGVWRSSQGGGHWQPISDRLPSQSTGALALDGGRLWLATGEANTNADAYLGSGVYALSNPRYGAFTERDRVGGPELENTTIHQLRFAGGRVWAATSSGVWSHSSRTLTGAWKLEYAPNPDYLPGHPKASDPDAPYKNITNDVAVDPRHPSRVVLAVGWRSGDDYNGFYAKAADGSWHRLTTGLGDLPTAPDEVGSVTFARSADGSRYYAIDQSPTQLATNPDSSLAGVYVSRSGSPLGPWKRIADYQTLAKSGSALTDPGYMPGVQAWYNQFLQVDPADPEHVWAGLEEVFETRDGGANWSAPGPYWNFGFSCWSIDPSKQTGDCNATTHPDQHAVAVGRSHGRSYLYVGDDGGVYRRPTRGAADASGHATDWTSLNDGTIDTLQYYSVGVGQDRDFGGVAVNGGLQDNGQSILRGRDRVMGSNFGGDGGDTLTDPGNGCNIAQEYVYLALQVTQNCAVNDGSWLTDPSKATSYAVAPPDNRLGGAGARFIAPLAADGKDGNTWIAGGRHVWVQTHGYAIRSSDEWRNAFDLGAGHVATAVASSGGRVYAAWCGPCNNVGFARGIAVGNADGTGWHQLNLPVDGTVPNRYLSGFAVDPANADHVYLAVNGFSRHWTEGPGAGIGHVFESWNGGTSWKDVSANLPDAPADALLVLPGGGVALATDLGVVYRAPHRSGWEVVGDLPAVAVQQLKLGPDGKVYAATHGRGIWSVKAADLR
ncbi:glycosyl hydrolase [Streptacidiphilus sp. ASG 303]|uniref:glycosyl hydrolase n=1 Tax=Streptacidiphilus sp. ASG 303 TaxID=2896847 RepID=UPI001E4A2761|nr:glycosyl hydrolase [Streptacidiphilus sp. ASG 303]MCD0483405.1 glycosyl hydrolase [Streptacidiphilus sp. ASG 303]